MLTMKLESIKRVYKNVSNVEKMYNVPDTSFT